MGGISWADFFETPENLIRLAHQGFSLMAFLGVGSHVLSPGKICYNILLISEVIAVG